MNFVNRKLRFNIRRQYTVGQKIWICPGKKIVKLIFFGYVFPIFSDSKILNFIENIQKYFSWNWFSISIQFLEVLFYLNFLKFLAGCALQNFQKSSKMAETKGVCDRSSINGKKKFDIRHRLIGATKRYHPYFWYIAQTELIHFAWPSMKNEARSGMSSTSSYFTVFAHFLFLHWPSNN